MRYVLLLSAIFTLISCKSPTEPIPTPLPRVLPIPAVEFGLSLSATPIGTGYFIRGSGSVKNTTPLSLNPETGKLDSVNILNPKTLIRIYLNFGSFIADTVEDVYAEGRVGTSYGTTGVADTVTVMKYRVECVHFVQTPNFNLAPGSMGVFYRFGFVFGGVGLAKGNQQSSIRWLESGTIHITQ